MEILTMVWTWDQIRARQLEGKVMCTWSASGKSQNVEFTVDSIDETGLTFRKQNGKLQRVSREAAQNVLDNWDRYKNGEIERAELAAANFSTSYLFGLLREMESLHAGGRTTGKASE
jgi:hypothetical protein